MSQLDSLRAAVAVSPQNVPLLLLFGQACLDEWSPDEGRQAFERVLAIEPANPAARIGIAKILHLEGKTSEAIVRIEALLHEQPAHAAALVFLSRLQMGEGSVGEARANYQQALRLDPAARDTALEKELYAGGQKPAPAPEPEKVLANEEPWQDSGSEKKPPMDVDRPTIKFDDVGGMDAVKEEIRMKIIYPLKNPDLFRAYGKKIGGGVLLYGPPGCGKTLLSRATAGEIQANFISIGIHQILDLYLGNSEKNLHQLFELARDNAPAILFFDEVDALAADRNDLRKSAGRTLINQFLAEMDGTAGNNDGLLILGATNAPWHIDPAFRRPGRFDRILFVPPPDEPARASVIEIMARNKPVSKLDIDKIARKTKDFSGADLKAMFDLTIERALARAMREGKVVPIETSDLLNTAASLKPSTKAWFESAKNYAIYSNQGGFYDDVLTFLGIKK
ncbi:MAG: AAA family ATPase [Chthoniobacteraceae bacterium]